MSFGSAQGFAKTHCREAFCLWSGLHLVENVAAKKSGSVSNRRVLPVRWHKAGSFARLAFVLALCALQMCLTWCVGY